MDKLILGIDPGSHKTGLALLDLEGVLQHYSTLRFSREISIGERALELSTRILNMLQEYEQNNAKTIAAGIEGVHFSVNAQTALKLQQMGAAAEMACLSLPISSEHIYTVQPAEWKVLTGSGNASKDTARRFVNMVYGLDLTRGLQDQADAILIAEVARQKYVTQSLA